MERGVCPDTEPVGAGVLHKRAKRSWGAGGASGLHQLRPLLCPRLTPILVISPISPAEQLR